MSGDRTLALLRRYRGGVAAAAVAVALAAPGLLDSYKNGLRESYELALLLICTDSPGFIRSLATASAIFPEPSSMVEVVGVS
jgi:hypothetical protein